jgi:hypothetical protein
MERGLEGIWKNAVLAWDFPGGIEENRENAQSRKPVFRPRSEHFPNTSFASANLISVSPCAFFP